MLASAFRTMHAIRGRLLITILISLFLTVQATGFCYRKLKWLSENDFKQRALEFSLSYFGKHEDAKNPEKFLRSNPDCCSLTKSFASNSITISAIECLSGTYITTAKMIIPSKNGYGYYRSYVEMNNCGHILRSYGTDD